MFRPRNSQFSPFLFELRSIGEGLARFTRQLGILGEPFENLWRDDKTTAPNPMTVDWIVNLAAIRHWNPCEQ
jgi:hypothetical protein